MMVSGSTFDVMSRKNTTLSMFNPFIVANSCQNNAGYLEDLCRTTWRIGTHSTIRNVTPDDLNSQHSHLMATPKLDIESRGLSSIKNTALLLLMVMMLRTPPNVFHSQFPWRRAESGQILGGQTFSHWTKVGILFSIHKNGRTPFYFNCGEEGLPGAWSDEWRGFVTRRF